MNPMYEVRITSSRRYTFWIYEVYRCGERIGATLTLWGAERMIRRENARRARMAEINARWKG